MRQRILFLCCGKYILCIHPHRLRSFESVHITSSSQTVCTHSQAGWLIIAVAAAATVAAASAVVVYLLIRFFRSFVRLFARSLVRMFVCLILLFIFSSFTIYSILLKLLVARAHFLAPAISLNVVYECN